MTLAFDRVRRGLSSVATGRYDHPYRSSSSLLFRLAFQVSDALETLYAVLRCYMVADGTSLQILVESCQGVDHTAEVLPILP